MAESESTLLQRFVGTGDSEAFAQIVGRYAGLVYSTCLRILADRDRAADATQETFFQLTRRAGEVRGSLPGWLHRVATGKAVDLIRNDSARRQREQVYAEDKSRDDQTWREVSPYVDEALNGLDEQARGLLISHYLEGLPMAEIAQQRGVSRPTVFREIESGLARLRAQLRRKGVLVTAGALSTLLVQNTARSAPAAVLQQLGKIALVGTEAAPLTSSVGGGVAAAVKIKIVVIVAALATGAGLITYRSLSPGASPTVSAPPAAGHESRQVPRRTTAQPDRPVASEAERREVGRPAATQTDSAAMPWLQSAAAQPTVDAEPPVLPPKEAGQSNSDFHLDLSTPEATVRSFTKALASGNAESVMACMLPGGEDYDDVQQTMNAGPDDPDEQQAQLFFQAFDPDAEMPITKMQQTDQGTVIVWQVTFKKDVTMQGHTFYAGDTFELDATLRQSGDRWLIERM